MKYAFPKGSTSVIIPVFIQDSSSTTGAGLGGLIETSNVVGGYLRPGGLGIALVVDLNVATEGTYVAPTTVGQVRIGNPVNMRTGMYEFHFHNDLFATGADAVFITLGGATNMADIVIEIQLTNFNLNAAAPNVNVTLIEGSDATDTLGVAQTGDSYARIGDKGSALTDVSGVIFSGTADSGSTTTLVDDALTISDVDYYKGAKLFMTGGLAIDEERLIVAFAPGTDTITVSPPFTQAIAAAATYVIIRGSAVDIGMIAYGLTASDNLKLAGDAYSVTRGLAGTALPEAVANTAAGIPILSQLRTSVGVNSSDVLDELSQGAPVTNPSLGTAAMANYMAQVHKYVVDSSANFKEVYNAAGTKIFKKALTDAASVFTEAKAITGA